MLLPSIIAAAVLVIAAVIQWWIALRFLNSFRQRGLPDAWDTTSPQSLPAAAVIVSVRGCDPSLADSIRGVCNQAYEDFEVHVVVDSPQDEAWQVIQAIQRSEDPEGRIRLHAMSSPPSTCSLKCHSIVQALSQLSDSVEVVAFLDADVTPHTGWLTSLVTPLANPGVGAVTGNQWFEPEAPATLGSLTRSTWNGGAVVLSAMFANPWAGSLAMRWQDIRNSGLQQAWQRSIVDDGPVQQAVESLGLTVQFAPALIMVNREPCTFTYVNRWALRMLTWSRLHEPTFYLSILHATFSNSVMLMNFGLLLAAVGWHQWAAAATSASGLIVSGVLSVAAYAAARNCAVHSCKLRGQTLPPLSWPRAWAVFWLVAVAQVVFGVACLRSIFVRQISWRGIRYRFKNKNTVERLNYEPYLASDSHDSTDTKKSSRRTSI